MDQALRKERGRELQCALDVRSAEYLDTEAVLEGATQAIGAVELEQIVELIDVPDPVFRAAMNDLREVGQGRLAEVEELLALEVPLGALAGDPAIDHWAAAKKIEGFFEDAEQRAARLSDDERTTILDRLTRARRLVGAPDALQRLHEWKSPDER